MLCSGLVLVQIVVNVIWFLLEPPEAVYHHPTREDNMLVCQVGGSGGQFAWFGRLHTKVPQLNTYMYVGYAGLSV